MGRACHEAMVAQVHSRPCSAAAVHSSWHIEWGWPHGPGLGQILPDCAVRCATHSVNCFALLAVCYGLWHSCLCCSAVQW